MCEAAEAAGEGDLEESTLRGGTVSSGPEAEAWRMGEVTNKRVSAGGGTVEGELGRCSGSPVIPGKKQGHYDTKETGGQGAERGRMLRGELQQGEQEALQEDPPKVGRTH